MSLTRAYIETFMEYLNARKEQETASAYMEFLKKERGKLSSADYQFMSEKMGAAGKASVKLMHFFPYTLEEARENQRRLKYERLRAERIEAGMRTFYSNHCLN